MGEVLEAECHNSFPYGSTRGNTMASVEDLIPVDALGQAELVRRGEITPIELSVRDSAALLDATSGPDVGDPYWAPPPERPSWET